MKSTIHKCIVNDIPVGIKTQYTNLAESKVNNRIPTIIENSDFAYFSIEISLLVVFLLKYVLH